ncbi:hypothetical protein L1987_26985 [Smallanthus sonchifolius]|uniref:Uncharacterized protein n=1 Tax=Smallanthus sonchifolius TaxID=185202 RepID=A0ACB9IAJ9_9ASTR|nr:hypothetical protein L1987_26985 [Smallanthus sonchifolius]
MQYHMIIVLQSENPSVDIWVDSVSLQPFTPEEWKSHQYQSIEKIRRSRVKIQAVNGEGKPQANKTLIIAQKFARFPFGCAINKNILYNQAYKNWFISRFKYTTFENEMKWYTNEPSQNREDYTAADALLQFAKSNGVSVRGHNVLWDATKFQPNWVSNLGPSQLAAAATARIKSVIRRYSGQVIAWDVVNENLHNNFFESKLGVTASSKFYMMARALDRTAALFLNDYNTIEWTKPLHLIAEYLDQVLREAHAHPAVNGIVLWSAWSPQGCYRMCLTDNNFKNLPTGDVVDKIIREHFNAVVTATTDLDGFYETSLIHGDYEVSFADKYESEKQVKFQRMSHQFKVEASEDTLHVKILA